MTKIDIQLDIGENWYEPMRFVDALVYAEELGYKTAWFGDHFFPWFHSGKGSQFIWSTLGVALERTAKIKTGPLVTVPIGARYHPAIIAQASATLDNMYPGRFLLGVGTGEALNERPFWNGKWPEWAERMQRLVEGIELIRMLWNSKEPFRFRGKFFYANFYHLYTKPKTEIPIYFSAIGKKAAWFAGKYADKLVTLGPRNNVEKLREEILPSYQSGLKDSKRKGGFVVEVSFSFMSPQEVKKKEWRSLGIVKKDSWSFDDPMIAEKAGKDVTTEELKKNVHFCRGWKDLIGIIENYAELGAEAVVLGSEANKEKIKEFADNVLKVF